MCAHSVYAHCPRSPSCTLEQRYEMVIEDGRCGSAHPSFTILCTCLAWSKPSQDVHFCRIYEPILHGTPTAVVFLVPLVRSLWRWSGLVWLNVLSWATCGVSLVLQGAPQRLSPADVVVAAQSYQ
ncbi:hypothetical protein PAXRUDRAFT_642061 [Paxillus rubicundulus Ve08.2h10]|uniref:Unplaced genomic scaffold scaffold_590, whole genome shotgun sequence n=1 Tax=Paxillus rubicundulus Ve08.2h10 TaxID=930991 RepID=A0A0D0D3Z7_9AGAM|nr:hypothetical protein PAXRUDRAFT_642061 [Paxillus rubicundulus Ve08.2h10]